MNAASFPGPQPGPQSVEQPGAGVQPGAGDGHGPEVDPARFLPSDRMMIEALGRELAAMQREGVRIAVPQSYLLGMGEYGIDCNWECTRPVQLRIDADGVLMLCNEYRTGLADLFNVTRLDPGSYSRWVDEWFEERRRIDCSGCYWSCFIHAEENIRLNRLEFDYM